MTLEPREVEKVGDMHRQPKCTDNHRVGHSSSIRMYHIMKVEIYIVLEKSI
jgi:hypothetical protein